MHKPFHAALAALALVASAGAHAGTYQMTFSGPGALVFAANKCLPGSSVFPECRVPVAFAGSLTFNSFDASDGVHGAVYGTAATPGSFAFALGSGFPFGSGEPLTGSLTYTVLGGRVTAVDGGVRAGAFSSFSALSTADFSGLAVAVRSLLARDADFYEGRGTLVAAVPAIPEPDTWALLAAGLGAVGWAARRRGGAARHVNTFHARQRALSASLSGV